MATTTLASLLLLVTMGCGDRCERLCREVGTEIAVCAPNQWSALGVRSRADFVARCRADWERRSDDLTSSLLNEALEVCNAGRDDLEAASCDELVALYGLE